MSLPVARPLPSEGLAGLDFGETGLIPVVVQDLHTRDVLMLAFTNREMLAMTLQTGDAWFWSRRRGEPWHKGATSGNYIRVREVRRNCEDNSLLFLAEPVGPVCHTGAQNCYYRTLDGAPVSRSPFHPTNPLSPREPAVAGTGDSHAERLSPESAGGLDWLFEIVSRPPERRRPGSYTGKLLEQGVDRIAKKVGEEAAEVIIAAKNRSHDELASEMADLWYHALVLLADAGMTPADVYRVLAARHREREPAGEPPG